MVTDMVLTEWNQEKYDEAIRREGREEGLEKGLKLSIKVFAKSMSNAKQIHAAILEDESYKHITLAQVEEILAELFPMSFHHD